MPKNHQQQRKSSRPIKSKELNYDSSSDSSDSDEDWEPEYNLKVSSASSDSDWEDIDISIVERGSEPTGIKVIYEPVQSKTADKSPKKAVNDMTLMIVGQPIELLKKAMTSAIQHSVDDEDISSTNSMTKEKLALLKKLPEDIEYTEEEFEYLAKQPKPIQKAIIEKEKQIIALNIQSDPLRFRILNGDMPIKMKSMIIQRIEHFNRLEPGDSEYSKLSSWIHTISRVPFGKYIQSPIHSDDSYEKIGDYMSGIRKSLDDAVYGHNSAKERIIELIAANIRNPEGRGYCIGIQGPAGNGKTTLIKHGVCRKLGRPFSMISLGGATDADFLAGHGYTYEGSRPGRMVEALIDSKCMNPVIFFDELDKVSQTARGEEIYGYLCHLIDFTQNDQIHDKFFAGIDFDFSRAIFVFSFNDESLINPILKDRIHIIRTDGFKDDDKVRIARDYLIKDILKDFNLKSESIDISDDIYRFMIRKYTNGEDGVRSLRRSLHSFISRFNINLLLGKIKTDTPVIVTTELVDEYMSVTKSEKTDKVPDMYI